MFSSTQSWVTWLASKPYSSHPLLQRYRITSLSLSCLLQNQMSFPLHPYSHHFPGQERKLLIFFPPPTFSRFQFLAHCISLAISSLTGHLTLTVYVIFLAGDAVSLNSSDGTRFCERRTDFIQQELLQAILRNYEPDIAVYTTTDTIDEFTEDLLRNGMHKPPQIGQPFVQFAIVQSKQHSKHRIIFRLSHGEYDAISMSYFIDSLKSIYEDLPNAEYGHFSQYVCTLSLHPQLESGEFWSNLLIGALMTEIVPRVNVDSQVPSELHFCAPRTVEINKLCLIP